MLKRRNRGTSMLKGHLVATITATVIGLLAFTSGGSRLDAVADDAGCSLRKVVVRVELKGDTPGERTVLGKLGSPSGQTPEWQNKKLYMIS